MAIKDIFKQQSINEGVLLVLYLASVIAIALPRSLYGFDMEDEGWALTTYQNIFSCPASVCSTFLCYNGMLAGGIWHLLFGQYGLLAFRCLYVIGEVLKALLVYAILRRYCNRLAICVGFFVLECVYRADVYMDHYQLTSILCLLSILFIIRSLDKRQWQYMFVAGIVVGINVFTRVSNIVFCAFILVLVLFWLHTKQTKLTWHLLYAALGGFVAGCLVEILLMTCLGHLSLFLGEIASGFSFSGDTDSSHSFGALGQTYLTQIARIGLHTAIMVTIVLAFALVKKKIEPWNKTIYIVLTGILTCIALVVAYYQYTSVGGTALFAVQTLICIYVLYKSPYELKYVIALAIMLLYTLPLGCDYGYDSKITAHAMCLSLPLAIALLLPEISLAQIKHSVLILPLCLLLLVIGGYSAFVGGFTAYIGYRNDSVVYKTLFSKEATNRVHSPLATTVILGDYLPIRLNPLLDEMTKYVNPGDVVLCFQSPAMVHYLTQTRPYLNNPWPWTYTPAEMERRFKKAQAESDVLPVIVREKGFVRDIFNDRNYPDWDNAHATESHWHKNKRIKLIQDYISCYQYKVVWEDNAFQLLLPQSSEQSIGVAQKQGS